MPGSSSISTKSDIVAFRGSAPLLMTPSTSPRNRSSSSARNHPPEVQPFLHSTLHQLLPDSTVPPMPSYMAHFPQRLRIGSLPLDSTSSLTSRWTTPHFPRPLRIGSRENASQRKEISFIL